MTIDMLVPSNSSFCPLLSYGNSPQWMYSLFLIGFTFGFYLFFKIGGSWSAHGLPWVLLSTMWLCYYGLVFVCFMQLLSYMLWMKNVQWLSHWKVKVDLHVTKGLFNYNLYLEIYSGHIYHIKFFKSSINAWVYF